MDPVLQTHQEGRTFPCVVFLTMLGIQKQDWNFKLMYQFENLKHVGSTNIESAPIKANS